MCTHTGDILLLARIVPFVAMDFACTKLILIAQAPSGNYKPVKLTSSHVSLHYAQLGGGGIFSAIAIRQKGYVQSMDM